jgi:hypothetical protein
MTTERSSLLQLLLCSWQFTSLDTLREDNAFIMKSWYLLDASKRRDMSKYALRNVTSQKTRIINISAVET